MPLFSSAFSPKKTPPRKSASLSNLHTLDYSTRAVELGLDYGAPSVTIGNQKLVFLDDGEWAAESVGGGGGAAGGAALKRLEQRNHSLEEENFLLKLKLTLLMDMLCESTADSQHLERQLARLKSRSKEARR
ncbi:protein chibby homolog 1-like [Petromyzon marinus]|uniref:protein chibby homolog 1 n=1 Tax=Petromyzon marinus TaxID=7757 RepID=UPI003F6FE228